MSSITNQIVANIKRTSTNLNSQYFVDTENVVCIDTSENRIGINLKKPEYSIDISGNLYHHAIRVNNLHIKNLADIQEISCNQITGVTEFKAVQLEASQDISTAHVITKDITCHNITIANDIILSNQQMSVHKMSAEYLDVANSINVNTLEASQDISTARVISKDISCDNITIANITNYAELTVDTFNCANISDIQDLSSNFINVQEISCNDIYIKENIFTLGDTSCIIHNLIVPDGGTAVFGDRVDMADISARDITCNSMLSNTLNVNTIRSANGKVIMSNGIIGDTTNPGNSRFNQVVVNTLSASSDCNIDGKTDLANGALILPYYLTVQNQNMDIAGALSFDANNNDLKLYYDGVWNNIMYQLKYANIILDTDKQAPELSFSPGTQNLVVNYNTPQGQGDPSDLYDLDLYLNTALYPTYKFVPMRIDNSVGNFVISQDGKTILIDTYYRDKVYEIHASIGIKYFNQSPGDVEPNTYTVGIYPNFNTGNNDVQSSIDNVFVDMKGSVVAFDNNFNYGNLSLNYIGRLATNTNEEQNRTGFNFYISSEKDISCIHIDKLNLTIKQV